MLRRIFSYMKQYKKYAYLALFCIAVEVVLELMVPLIMADLIDTGVANADEMYIYKKGIQMVCCAAAALFFGIGRNYPLKDITRVCYNEIEEIEVYKGKRRVFKVSSGTYGMDELVEWFREEGVLVEDNTPREEYYKVMLHTEKAWLYIIVLNVLAFTPAIVVILYYMHRDIPLETTREVFEAIVSYIVMIGMYIATWVAVVGEKTFYLKYQDGKYSYHHWFRKEKTFELDERITYKAREDGIVIYQDNKRLFLTSHGYTNAEFFGRTLLEKNIKCIKGEQYMEKYRDKGQEEI